MKARGGERDNLNRFKRRTALHALQEQSKWKSQTPKNPDEKSSNRK